MKAINIISYIISIIAIISVIVKIVRSFNKPVNNNGWPPKKPELWPWINKDFSMYIQYRDYFMPNGYKYEKNRIWVVYKAEAGYMTNCILASKTDSHKQNIGFFAIQKMCNDNNLVPINFSDWRVQTLKSHFHKEFKKALYRHRIDCL